MLTGPKTSLTIEQFAARLAPVLGSDQALLTVRAGARAIAREGDVLSPDDQRAVLSWLGAQSGVVAAAARHLLRKFDAGSESRVSQVLEVAAPVSEVALAGGMAGARSQPAPSASVDTGLRQAPRSSLQAPGDEAGRTDTLPRSELEDMFARATGHERAQQLVERACSARGASGPVIARSVAILVLEDLAAEPGVVGVVARFAKARVALKPR